MSCAVRSECLRIISSPRNGLLRVIGISRGSTVGAPQCLSTWTDKLRRIQSYYSSHEPKENVNGGPDPKESKNHVKEAKVEPLRTVKELESMLEETDEQLKLQTNAAEEFKDKYIRTLAEMENLRKLMGKRVEEAKLYGIQNFAEDMLEVADILQKATESVSTEDLKKNTNSTLVSVYDGLKLTGAQLQKVLIKNGVTKIHTAGEVFDPKIHEALYEVPGEKPGTVAEVLRVGYLLNGRTIRAAQVGVVKEDQC